MHVLRRCAARSDKSRAPVRAFPLELASGRASVGFAAFARADNYALGSGPRGWAGVPRELVVERASFCAAVLRRA